MSKNLKYAKGTKVGSMRSRGQIGKLLMEFGATGVQWTDEWIPERSFTIRFIWMHEETQLMARIKVTCNRKKIEEEAMDGRSGRVSELKKEKILSQWDAESHRLLLLFLKGTFFAIESGIISAEQIFLSFFEDSSGRTVWEVIGSKIGSLPMMNSSKLLTDGR